jgi:general secretion pathway protein K
MDVLNPISNRRGMALLITLTVITLLVVTTMELNRRARATVIATAAVRDRHRLSEILASSVHAAMAMLVDDKKNGDADSIQEDWADPEKVQIVMQSIPFNEGKVEVSISDELSRIQVNALVKFPDSHTFNDKQVELWDRFLKLAFLVYEHPDEINPTTTIINSLKDWLDSGDDEAITGLSGAESDYYQDLDPPYSIRNGPLTHLNEFLLVKGVTPELFYGTDELPGISDFLTVSGMTDEGVNITYEGKININTADVPVLMALLPEENRDLAGAISDFRIAKSDDTFTHNISTGIDWYKQVPGAGDIELDPELITNKSDFFKIEAAASLNNVNMTATVIVRRVSEGESGQIRCRILSWELN